MAFLAKTHHDVRVPALVLALLCLCAAVLLIAPTPAQAVTCNKTAYNRVVKAMGTYKKYPEGRTVDLSDLGLSKKKVAKVAKKIHQSGEFFWVSTESIVSKKNSLSFTWRYSPKKIPTMRKAVTKAVKKAKKRLKKGMSQATKVHMLHDWYINRMKTYPTEAYRKAKGWKCKNAYATLVSRKGDCYGFALGFDLLLKRCGFSTEVVINMSIDHSWNIVKVNGKWYHVDTTWDSSWTGRFFWKKETCHWYLLRSDKAMKQDTLVAKTKRHGYGKGWTADHKCTSEKYSSYAQPGGYFSSHCKDWK